MSLRWGGAGTCYQAKGSWVVILIWSGGPNTSFTLTLSTSSLIEADSSMGLLLGKSAEFVLGHFVGGVCLFHGFLQVDEVQGSILTAE